MRHCNDNLIPYARTCAVLILGVGLATASLPAYAGDGWLSRYNLGVGYAASTSYAAISYDAPVTATIPSSCSASDEAGQMRCTAYLAPDTSSGADITVFIDQPFKRTGWFYFEPGLTFGTISYKGGLATKPEQQLSGAKPTKARTSTPAAPTGADATAQGTPQAAPTPAPTAMTATDDQPLTRAYMEMYGINWQAYLRFGVTPLYAPDILLSVGVGIQTVAGRLKIFTVDKNRFIVQPNAFAELEAVFVRAATGSLSVYLAQDTSVTTPLASQLIDDHPGGSALTKFQLGLKSASAGIRLLFPF